MITYDEAGWSRVEQDVIDRLKLIMHDNGDPFNVLWYCFQVVADEWPADGDTDKLEALQHVIDAIVIAERMVERE